MNEREEAIWKMGKYHGQAVEALMYWHPAERNAVENLDRIKSILDRVAIERQKAGFAD